MYESPHTSNCVSHLAIFLRKMRKQSNILFQLPPLSFPGLPKWQRALATTALSASLLTFPITTGGAPPPITEQVWTIINENYMDANAVQDTWSSQHASLFSPHKTEASAYKAVRASLKTLDDRYTRVLTPSQMGTLRKFDVSGLGLLLTADEGGHVIVSAPPSADSSAGAAGIRAGDELQSIDGVSIRGVAAFEVAQMLQGAECTDVKLGFRDGGYVSLTRHFATKTAAVTRAVAVRREDGVMGYVRLGEFAASARAEVEDAVRKVINDGAEWIVLDVRGNGGGIFEGALEIAGIFEGDGKVVARVSGRGGSGVEDVYRSRAVNGRVGEGLDVGLLVNGGSASSSEVLAGGMRDMCSAAIVGDGSTYGKGLIQGVFGLSDGGGVIVTVAEYTTPNGERIQGVGLAPDLRTRARGLQGLLHRLGIDRIDEMSVGVTKQQVHDVLRRCETRGRL